MKTKNIFDSWVAKIESGEGFTANLLGYEPKTGFAIAIDKKYERVIHYPKQWINYSIKAALHSYIAAHLLSLIDGAFLGVWIHEGRIYFDISEVEPDFATAINKGLANNQLAIYDLGQQVEISLSGLSPINNEQKIGQAEAKHLMNVEGE